MLEVDIRELKDDVGALKGDVGVLKADVSVLKEDVSALKGDVGVLKQDVSALKSDVGVLKTDVSVLKNDVGALKDDVRELKTVVVDGLGRLERIIFSESAETHAYVDLKVGEVRAEVHQLGTDLREEMRQHRQLTGVEFARAAVHADTLFEKLRVQLVLMAEHQAMLFERQERDHRG